MNLSAYARCLGTVGATAFGSGLVFGRVELVAIGAALLAVLVAGLLRVAEPAPDVTFGVADERIEEGGTTTVTVRIGGTADVVDVEVLRSAGLEVTAGATRRTVAPGAVVAFTVRPRRWGVHRVGPVLVRAYGPDRFTSAGYVVPPVVLRVLPRAEPFTASDVHPFTRAVSGVHVARSPGEGVEPAGVRDYRSGDQLRRINWRVSARHGSLYVTEHHPERNAEVVLLLDTFADVGPYGASSLDVAVRAALGIATHYLDRGDRVGVVGFGGVLRWLYAGTGPVQLHRVVEHLLGTELVLSYAWKDVDLLPTRALPPRSLVIALSPLRDERGAGALADLARRGFGVVVVDTAPGALVPRSDDPIDRAATGIVEMQRESLRGRLGELGVPVAPWEGPGSLDAVLHAVARLHARPKAALR